MKDVRTKSRKIDPLPAVRTGSAPLSVRTQYKFRKIQSFFAPISADSGLEELPLFTLNNPSPPGRLLWTALCKSEPKLKNSFAIQSSIICNLPSAYAHCGIQPQWRE